MNTFGGVIKLIFKKPITMLVISLIMAGFSVLCYMVIIPACSTLGVIARKDIFLTILYGCRLAFNFLISRGITFLDVSKYIFAILLLIAAVSFIFAGYLNVINVMVSNNKFQRGDFFRGVQRYFVKTLTVSIKVFLITIALITVFVISLTPSIIINAMLTGGKIQWFYHAVVINFITIGLIILGYIFYSSYISSWYMSIPINTKRPFANAKQAVRNNFGAIVRNVTFYSMLLIILEMSLLFISRYWFLEATDNFGRQVVIITISTIFKISLFTAYLSKTMSIVKYKVGMSKVVYE